MKKVFISFLMLSAALVANATEYNPLGTYIATEEMEVMVYKPTKAEKATKAPASINIEQSEKSGCVKMSIKDFSFGSLEIGDIVVDSIFVGEPENGGDGNFYSSLIYQGNNTLAQGPYVTAISSDVQIRFIPDAGEIIYTGAGNTELYLELAIYNDISLNPDPSDLVEKNLVATVVLDVATKEETTATESVVANQGESVYYTLSGINVKAADRVANVPYANATTGKLEIIKK